MLNEIKTKVQTTVNSREFQTVAGQIGIVVAGMLINRALTHVANEGLMKLMDKIHGPLEGVTIEEVAAAE